MPPEQNGQDRSPQTKSYFSLVVSYDPDAEVRWRALWDWLLDSPLAQGGDQQEKDACDGKQ